MLLSQSLDGHEGKSADSSTRSKEKRDNFFLSGNDQLKLSFTGKSKSIFCKYHSKNTSSLVEQRTYVDGH